MEDHPTTRDHHAHTLTPPPPSPSLEFVHRESTIQDETFQYALALANEGVPMYFNLFEIGPIRFGEKMLIFARFDGEGVGGGTWPGLP